MSVGEWTLRTDVVMRDETPREALEAATRSSRRLQDGTLKDDEAHERMNPAFARRQGAGIAGRPQRSVGNDEARVGSG
jgi:hypothetical protein